MTLAVTASPSPRRRRRRSRALSPNAAAAELPWLSRPAAVQPRLLRLEPSTAVSAAGGFAVPSASGTPP